MPDITMCSGDGCRIRSTCYRFNAKPCEFRQSYFVEPPVKEDGDCDYYWHRMDYLEQKEDQGGWL